MYLEGKVGTITEVYSLQAAVARRVIFPMDDVALGISAGAKPLVRLGESVDALVGDTSTFDETDSFQLRQGG